MQQKMQQECQFCRHGQQIKYPGITQIKFMQDIQSLKVLKNQASVTNFNGRMIISNNNMTRLQSQRQVSVDHNGNSLFTKVLPLHKNADTEESGSPLEEQKEYLQAIKMRKGTEEQYKKISRVYDESQISHISEEEKSRQPLRRHQDAKNYTQEVNIKKPIMHGANQYNNYQARAMRKEMSLASGVSQSQAQDMQFSIRSQQQNNQQGSEQGNANNLQDNIFRQHVQESLSSLSGSGHNSNRSKFYQPRTDIENQVSAFHRTLNSIINPQIDSKSNQFNKGPVTTDEANGLDVIFKDGQLGEEADQCELCGKTFEEHDKDLNFSLFHEIADLQILLEKSQMLSPRTRNGREMTIIEETIGDSKLTTFANQEHTQVESFIKPSNPYHNSKFIAQQRKTGSVALQNFDNNLLDAKGPEDHMSQDFSKKDYLASLIQKQSSATSLLQEQLATGQIGRHHGLVRSILTKRQLMNQKPGGMPRNDSERLMMIESVQQFNNSGQMTQMSKTVEMKNGTLNLGALPTKNAWAGEIKSRRYLNKNFQQEKSDPRSQMSKQLFLTRNMIPEFPYKCRICCRNDDQMELFKCFEAILSKKQGSHDVCRQCMRTHIMTKLNNHHQINIKCLHPDCNYILSQDEVSELLTPYEFNKYYQIKRKFTSSKFQQYVACNQCKKTFNSVQHGTSVQVTCPSCFLSLCRVCEQPSHNGISCEKKIEELYLQTLRLFMIHKNNYQICIKCDRVLRRNENCNHFTCDSCLISFCLHCRLPFDNNHLNPFSAKPCQVFFRRELEDRKNNQKRLIKQMEIIDAFRHKRKASIYVLIPWLILGILISIPISFNQSMRLFKNLAKSYKKPYFQQEGNWLFRMQQSKQFETTVNILTFPLVILLVPLMIIYTFFAVCSALIFQMIPPKNLYPNLISESIAEEQEHGENHEKNQPPINTFMEESDNSFIQNDNKEDMVPKIVIHNQSRNLQKSQIQVSQVNLMHSLTDN
ncbi:hypothetical protein FGO68_gene7675 [Halteria grandinella]|uniref:RING-type domain-containing protein n=1 Tax=Halteria grandinella TaxID=5974 RepID=A0A8J8P347_HALGN|nr:hypothetical protein FGO68_gene7675 [Halteria grandinella]